MPRDELNNPTERIGRLLEEYLELLAAYVQMAELLAKSSPEAFERLPPRPQGNAVREEVWRRQYTMGKTIASRNSMRRLRAGFRQNRFAPRGEEEPRRAVKDLALSPEEVFELIKGQEELPLRLKKGQKLTDE